MLLIVIFRWGLETNKHLPGGHHPAIHPSFPRGACGSVPRSWDAAGSRCDPGPRPQRRGKNHHPNPRSTEIRPLKPQCFWGLGGGGWTDFNRLTHQALGEQKKQVVLEICLEFFWKLPVFVKETRGRSGWINGGVCTRGCVLGECELALSQTGTWWTGYLRNSWDLWMCIHTKYGE